MAPKGKKFTAAEKHFEKKRVAYEKTIKGLQDKNAELKKSNEALGNLLAEKDAKIEKLEVRIARLVELSEMTPEQIAEFFEKIDSQAKTAQTIESFAKITGLIGRY